MVAPVYEDGLVLAVTKFDHSGLARTAMVTYALRDADAPLTAQEWADLLQLTWQTNWKDRTDNSVTISSTSVLRGNGDDTPSAATSTAAGTAGTFATTSSPANCAVLVKKSTAFGGRVNRGRMYLPWVTSAGEDGVIAGADVTALQTDANDWKAAIVADGHGTLCIANRVYDLPWTDPARVLTNINIGHDITALTVETVLATQRRRMPR